MDIKEQRWLIDNITEKKRGEGNFFPVPYVSNKEIYTNIESYGNNHDV